MKILILGAGQVGRTAADHLSREEANEVTVVDVNEDVLRELQDRLDVRTVAGNAAHPSVLEAAGTAETDIVVAEGDEIFFLAARNDIRRVMEELRHGDDPARRIVIAGGGNIGFRLARSLESHNQVKLIERDARRARRIAELLESAIVLHGDAADEELLIEENIDSADVFAALTNSEEANILSAMLAKRLGAHKVIALINKPSYTELVESSSIDIAISPQTITIGSLLAHVRRGDVVPVHALQRGAAEAIEAIVHGDERSSRGVGKMVGQIALPEGASIGAVVRGEEVIMAHHDTLVQADDHVILFLADRRHLEAVERLFLRSAG